MLNQMYGYNIPLNEIENYEPGSWRMGWRPNHYKYVTDRLEIAFTIYNGCNISSTCGLPDQIAVASRKR